MLKPEEYKSKVVKRDDLQEMADNLGGIYSTSKNNTETIMNGVFDYRQHGKGLTIHVSHATEVENTSNLVELPPCLSFNIIFEGKINFSLANHRYQLGALAKKRGSKPVECSAIIVPQAEVFTRHLSKGMNVCKVNLFVERSWLEARCKSTEEVNLLNKIFQNTSVFLNWEASKETVALARQQIERNTSGTLYDKLNDELLAIDLLSHCMRGLELSIDRAAQNITAKNQQHTPTQQKLKQRIDAELSHHYSLKEIAASQGFSISTLQRKFKKSYGMTVSVYCSQRRLEMAKKALVLEGLSIGEAGYLAGYSHSSNFIAAFKKRFLITPAALIKNHQKLKSS